MNYTSDVILTKPEIWIRFQHEEFTDGTVRDYYCRNDGTTSDIKIDEYKIIHE